MDSDDRRTQLSPQFAMRVAILGGIALVLFAIVFFRLWFLQILSGDQYLAEASGNRVRDIVIEAPRGEMADRNGRVLVENRPAVAIVVSPPRLPNAAAKRHALLARLSRVLGRSTTPSRCMLGSGRTARTFMRMPIECTIDKQSSVLPYADVVVDPDATQPQYSYVAERVQEFPGISTENTYLRWYPLKSVGAHLFGTVGQIDQNELRDPHYRGVRGGSIVGKNGLEAMYDRYLRGQNGAQRIEVDSLGRAKARLRQRAPIRGNDLRVSIDAGLQKAAQDALATGIELGRSNGNPARGGAFVAMNPNDGEIYAMGSNPTFDPNEAMKPMTDAQYRARYGEAAGSPLFDRATDGGYASGSVFKPMTAAAALAAGRITTGEVYGDTGTWTSPDGAQRRRNAGGAVYGPVDLEQALAKSVDTYFYNLGARLNADPTKNPNGGALQQWARKFGFGESPGIDLPGGGARGTVPDPHWRAGFARREAICRKRRHVASCGISDMRPWSIGDSVSLAIGQGDFLASPLQFAVAYSAIENGGTIVRPHVGMQVLDANGRVIQSFAPRPVRRISIPGLGTIQQGLFDSTSSAAGGTSADVFEGFPYRVYGKTGTAQRIGQPDTSWYVAYVPDPFSPIVVACVIEDGGFGAEAAAPAVRLILSQWFHVRKEVKAGRSPTA